NNIIIQKVHKCEYNNSFAVAGANLVYIGTEKDCIPKELEAAINGKTAALAFCIEGDDKGLSLRKVVEIARAHDVPLIVDAASELPPRSNLKRYIAEGADLVAFSGGKGILGPSDTGILCGRRDLIKLATVQMLPFTGIGRGAKVDRTQIIGMLEALRIFLEEDEETRFEGWMTKAQWIAKELDKLPMVSGKEVDVDKRKRGVRVLITLNERVPSTADVVFNLRKGNPSIWVNHPASFHAHWEKPNPNKISINTRMLKDGEEKIIVSALKKMLGRKVG
ncbi:unnamed protein product, partial [marine sediment metagenome]